MSSSNLLGIRVVNPHSTPYTGTVSTGTPVPQGLLFDGVELLATDRRTGRVHEASYLRTSTYEDGSVRWGLLNIQGTFGPGETLLDIVPNPAPLRYYSERMPSESFKWLDVELGFTVLLAQGEVTETVRLADPFAQPGNLQIHYQSQNMIWVSINVDLSTLGLEMTVYLQGRSGEGMARIEAVVRRKNVPGRLTPGADGGVPIIRAWVTDHLAVADPASAGQVIEYLPSGFPYPENAPCILGELGIVDGAHMAPLRMTHHGTHVTADWLLPESCVAMGGYWHPGQDIGDTTIQSMTDPLSVRGLMLRGGEKRSIEFVVGAGAHILGQEMINQPPQVFADDPNLYSDHLLSQFSDPIDPQSPSATRARFDVVQLASVDPAYASSDVEMPMTVLDFKRRGGTYRKAGAANRFYGRLHYGDWVWGDGFGGASHYDAIASYLINSLRGGNPQQTMAFWDEARVRLRHQRTTDWIWAQKPASPDHREALPAYEKGHQHGNASLPKITHTWVHGLCLGYAMTGHPELAFLIREFAHGLIKNYHLDGGKVPGNWQIGTALDPRDWGATTRTNLFGTSTGGSAAWGWQGNWGFRDIDRILTSACSILLYCPNLAHGLDLRAFIERVLDNVLRVETGIWGGRGFILNRANRGNHERDSEQGWMMAGVVRSIGWCVSLGFTNKDVHGGLYHRMLNFMLSPGFVVGGKLPTGKIAPAQMTAVFTEDGATTKIRGGLPDIILQSWYTWRADRGSVTKAEAFYDAYRPEISRLVISGEPLTNDPKFKAYVLAIDSAWNQMENTGAVDDGTWALLNQNQWTWFERFMWPNTNHCVIAGDTFAQAYLMLGRGDTFDEACRLMQAGVFYWGRYPTSGVTKIGDNPGHVACRIGLYPNSESKVWHGQCVAEVGHGGRVLEILEQLGHDVWDIDAPPIIPSPVPGTAVSADGVQLLPKDSETIQYLRIGAWVDPQSFVDPRV